MIADEIVKHIISLLEASFEITYQKLIVLKKEATSLENFCKINHAIQVVTFFSIPIFIHSLREHLSILRFKIPLTD